MPLNNSKHLYLVPFILVFVSVISYIFHANLYSSQKELSRIQQIVDRDIEWVQQWLYHDSTDSDLRPLQFFNTEIWYNDSLLFWNHGLNHKGFVTELDYNELIVKEDSSQKMFLFQKIFNSEDSLLNDFLIKKSGSHYQFKYDPGYVGEPHYLIINNHKYPISRSGSIQPSIALILHIVSSLLMFCYVLIFISTKFVNPHHLNYYFILLLSSVVILHVISHVLGWKDISVFADTNTLSFLNKSTGMLIIHSMIGLTCIMYIFRLSFQPSIHPKWHFPMNVINGFILTTLLVYLCYLAKGFISHEEMYLDPGRFLNLGIHAILLIIGLILGVGLLFFYAIYSLGLCKKYLSKTNIILAHTLGISMSLLLFPNKISIHPLMMGAFIVALIIMIDLYIDSRQKSVIWIIWWIVVLSGFLTALIYFYSFEKDHAHRISMIKNTYKRVAEGALDEVIRLHSQFIQSDIQKTLSRLPYPYILDQKDLKSFIEEELLVERLDFLYFKRLYLINKNREDVFSGSRNTYPLVFSKLAMSEQKLENIYYNPFESEYHLLYEIDALDHPHAPFLLKLSFTENIINRVLPEEILIIRNGRLLHPQITQLPGEVIEKAISADEDFHIKGYSGVLWKASNEFSVISIQPLGGLIKPMSLFSYLFTLTGIIVILVLLVNHQLPIIPFSLGSSFFDKNSLRSRIQLNIISLIIITFIIVGLLTAFYFKNILEESTERNKNQVFVGLFKALDDDITTSDNEQMALSRVQQTIDHLNPLIYRKVCLYSSSGEALLSSGQEDVFPLRMPYALVSGYMDHNGKNETEATEFTPEINHLPLYYGTSAPFAYVGIKRDSLDQVKENIIDFLSTLLNVYVFLFLLAGAIAIAISNSITRPLSTLADKLRAFKLGKTNEPLEWTRDDEIGTLIKDYNNLIVKLEESATIIAKTERDTAWREMAKQVAHEIKNPLTPMKLSIQYLQKALDNNTPNIENLLQRVSATLLEQINNLSDIANEFSHFGKMPQSNNEKIVINELVEAVHDLFRKREDMDIHLSEPINDLHVFADRGQLVRIFNNLLKNAIQAIPDDRRGKIELSLFKKGKNAVVKVSDNGIGIPDHMKSKVFTPNFTTKSSGTGLGLAISANIIDGFNGKIYFDSIPGKGTDFYVEIPLMRIEENRDEKNRVLLD